ncbi:DNA uptake protein [Candidatus Rickettsiella viridis]|uniref:DNA uptake protein n=1 Tax=Candidatus Rickettsiella viridis TaxID=676208 RepID=A0A2Z5UUE2_9COXI|nr:ComEA family DNA-binding protein [Candidatus Rickettsiella viridis]BBB14573.1 DNA uptake protein [Candidatus Rickettsiella viridis]
MGIYPSLLTTLLVSVLGTPALASQSIDTHVHSLAQQSTASLLARNHKEVTASVNINTADTKTLLELKGVGLKRAQTIISDRERNGPFKSVDDLMRVKGIGKKTVDQNHNKITV